MTKAPDDIPDLFNAKDDIQVAFERFDAQNPHVYDEIIKLASQMKARGYRRYSIRTILHIIRWHRDLKTSGDTFKINDHFSSRYVRKLVCEYPEFKGFFETRILTAR